jgi:hypothetical protein
VAKTKAVKWSIGADEPEDLQEFLSNDDIVLKNMNKKTKEVEWPGRGPFTFRVVWLKVAEIKNGENKGKDRIRVMLVLSDTSDEAKDWNGYAVFDGFNVTEQGTPFLKRFLKGLGLSWDDFYNKSKINDEDPPEIVQIGGIRFNGSKPVTVRGTVKVVNDDYSGDDVMVIRAYLPADDEPDDDDAEVEEDDDVTVIGEEADEDDDEDDEEEWTREDLEDEDLDTVKQVAKDDFGLKAKELKKYTDVEELLDVLFPEDDEDDDDDDEPDEDEVAELTEELEGMKVAGLRKRARKNDKDSDESFESMKKADLVQKILQQELNVPPF